ncbi:MAG: hypothetical protein ACREJT_12650 [Myxococcota bacterium]
MARKTATAAKRAQTDDPARQRNDQYDFHKAQGEMLAQVLLWTVRQAPAGVSHAMMMGAVEYLHRQAVGAGWLLKQATAPAVQAETPKPCSRRVRGTRAKGGKR